MRKNIIALVLGTLLTMPCFLRAEVVEIPLQGVVTMNPLPGDSPLDSPIQTPTNPPCPTCFLATIDGNQLAVSIEEPTIPAADATVVNASTGGIVLHRHFTSSISETISNTGVYVLHIETEGGALVGQFIVQ